MNKFEYRIRIKDVPYSITVDTSEGELVRIVVNQTVIFNEKCASWMSPRTDIMYFPFRIKDKNIAISVDDRELQHKYNIYIDGVSPIDQTGLYDDYERALKIVNGGFVNYIKNHWHKVLIKVGILAISFPWFALLYREEILTPNQFLFVSVVAIMLAPLLILGEWWFELRTVKKFKNRFRTTDVINFKNRW